MNIIYHQNKNSIHSNNYYNINNNDFDNIIKNNNNMILIEMQAIFSVLDLQLLCTD